LAQNEQISAIFCSIVRTFTHQMDELIEKVEQALNNIRPYLIADGGNVEVVEITSDFTVKLEFTGSCGSCPMSSMTFKAGLEEAILKNVPEIKKVEAINMVAFNA
jgi:Fe-S cluster biogenesis protein NfuA